MFQGSDTHSLSRVLEAVVRLCFETKNWDALNENILLLTKKRGQIKQVQIFITLHISTSLISLVHLKTVPVNKIEVDLNVIENTYIMLFFMLF